MSTQPSNVATRDTSQLRQQPQAGAVANGAQGTTEVPTLLPPVDVVEDDRAIVLTADLPGASRETLSIQVDGDTLTLEAPLNLELPAGTEPVYAEVRAGRWRRSFTLSRELDAQRIEAALKDGVLRLTVPKQAHAQPRRIQVQAA